MIKQVETRDGKVVSFDEQRIYKAIEKAFIAYGSDVKCSDTIEMINNVVNDVKYSLEQFDSDMLINIEVIQDYVENALIAHYPTIAKLYIKNRFMKNLIREGNDVIQSIISVESNDITKENANMCADTMSGMLYKVASTRLQKFTDECQLNKITKDYVDNNLIHIHDKDCYATKSLTCLQTPLDKVFNKGIHCNHAECRSPQRIITAAVMACMSLQTTQNEQHGGQAIPAFDYYLAPYVRKTYLEELLELEEFLGYEIPQLHDTSVIKEYVKVDIPKEQTIFTGTINNQIETIRQKLINRTVKRVHQAMESFIHNMNTIHSRGGNQVVFSSVNFGTDTTPEGRCIIRELLISQYEGVGNGSTAIFPILIFKRKAGINKNPGDPNYDLYKDYSLRCTAKRLFPNFVNLDASYNKSELWREDDPERYIHEVATMGKRKLQPISNFLNCA